MTHTTFLISFQSQAPLRQHPPTTIPDLDYYPVKKYLLIPRAGTISITWNTWHFFTLFGSFLYVAFKVTQKTFFIKIEVCGINVRFLNISENTKDKLGLSCAKHSSGLASYVRLANSNCFKLYSLLLDFFNTILLFPFMWWLCELIFRLSLSSSEVFFSEF